MVDIDALKEQGRVRPLQVDLAERGDITQPHRAARQPGLADAGRLPGLAGPRIVARPAPEAGGDPFTALCLVPGVDRAPAERLIKPAHLGPAQRAQRHGGIGRAEDRVPDLGDRHPARGGHDRKPGDIGGLALVRAHAERGIALQMFHGDEPFALREPHIIHGDIALVIDEFFGPARPGVRRLP